MQVEVDVKSDGESLQGFPVNLVEWSMGDDIEVSISNGKLWISDSSRRTLDFTPELKPGDVITVTVKEK